MFIAPAHRFSFQLRCTPAGLIMWVLVRHGVYSNSDPVYPKSDATSLLGCLPVICNVVAAVNAMPKATGRKPHANPVWGYYHVGATSQCKATCKHCNQKVAPYAPKLGQHLMYECRSLAADDRAGLRAALAEGDFDIPAAPSNDGTPPKKRQKPDTSGEQLIAFKAACGRSCYSCPPAHGLRHTFLLSDATIDVAARQTD
jgi:hypothetical protein